MDGLGWDELGWVGWAGWAKMWWNGTGRGGARWGGWDLLRLGMVMMGWGILRLGMVMMIMVMTGWARYDRRYDLGWARYDRRPRLGGRCAAYALAASILDTLGSCVATSISKPLTAAAMADVAALFAPPEMDLSVKSGN